MNRIFFILFVMVTSTLIGFLNPLQIFAWTSVEHNTDRMGNDYKRMSNISDPATCRGMCDSDAHCRAYTWVRPGVQEPDGVCYLKNPVPGATPNDCCVSGVKQPGKDPVPPLYGQPTHRQRTTLEYNTDRMGNDYKRMSNISDPATCRGMCDSDANCRAYTWVRPGVQEPDGVCYLKNPAPGATPNDCCISGVKR